jgi:hypothetical protein
MPFKGIQNRIITGSIPTPCFVHSRDFVFCGYTAFAIRAQEHEISQKAEKLNTSNFIRYKITIEQRTFGNFIDFKGIISIFCCTLYFCSNPKNNVLLLIDRCD